jgi:small subunit ribosomal protein S3
MLRNYIRNRLKKAGISRIIIERTPKRAVVTIHTSRPGIVIGKSGKEIAQLEEELKKITSKDVKILIHEIKRPELDAYLVSETIASQLEGRISFRRAMKQSITQSIRMGAEGVRVMCAGRLGGAEIARTEQYKEGRIPLQTIRADIDYATSTARTIYGAIGVKVWICKGEVIGTPGR